MPAAVGASYQVSAGACAHSDISVFAFTRENHHNSGGSAATTNDPWLSDQMSLCAVMGLQRTCQALN